jgi:hypothetical protein
MAKGISAGQYKHQTVVQTRLAVAASTGTALHSKSEEQVNSTDYRYDSEPRGYQCDEFGKRIQ